MYLSILTAITSPLELDLPMDKFPVVQATLWRNPKVCPGGGVEGGEKSWLAFVKM